MKAAILRELNTDLEIRDDVTATELGPDDVHVKLAASGVCHSDMSVQNGTIAMGSPDVPMSLPFVLGHEGAGVIQEVGSNVSSLKAGDHVVITFTPACQKCKPCHRGESHLCHGMAEMLAIRNLRLGDTFMGGGTFAEEMVIPSMAAIKIDPEVPLSVAALIGCGVTTGFGSAVNTANIRPGSSVLVIGCGGVGISTIQGARIAGASEIIAVDTIESKREDALKFGATHAVAPEDLEGAKLDITGGEGFDYSLECVGNPSTMRLVYDMTRRGGTVVIVGVGRVDQKIEFNAFELFINDKTIKGSMYGSANVLTDYDRMLRHWKAGQLDLEGMISRRIKLEDINDAFRAMEAGEVIRSVIDY